MQKKIIIWGLVGIVVLSLLATIMVMSPITERADKIAVMYIEGEIMSGGSGNAFQGGVNSDDIIQQLHEVRDDSSIKALILRIDSPGGALVATEEIAEEIIKLRQAGKLVVASMGDTAASGGYWLAAVCDKIYANKHTVTGSIGVIVNHINVEELMKKIGVSSDSLKTGSHKDIMSPTRAMTKEERIIIQQLIDESYTDFVATVAEGRKIDQAQVRQLADGRIYSGLQAKKLGLVDEMGNMYDAIDGVAVLAGINGKPEIKEYGVSGPLDMLFDRNTKTNLAELMVKKITTSLLGSMPLAVTDNSRWQDE